MKLITKILFFLLSLACTAIIYHSYFHNRWRSYYHKKLQEPARSFIVDALQSIDISNIKNPIAYDIGCSVGNETLLLLSKGYTVYAIDKEQLAFDFMLQRPQIKPYLAKIHPVVSSFQTIDFTNLPHCDLMIASYTLPFCPSENFLNFWRKLTKQIKPGGYFIGNTFDPQFMGFSKKDRKNMTFHTKEETLALFQDFTILQFEEIFSDDPKTKIINQTYEIVAQKIR